MMLPCTGSGVVVSVSELLFPPLTMSRGSPRSASEVSSQTAWLMLSHHHPQ